MKEGGKLRLCLGDSNTRGATVTFGIQIIPAVAAPCCANSFIINIRNYRYAEKKCMRTEVIFF